MEDSYKNEIESYGYEVKNDTRRRLLIPTWGPICTVAYAVTQQGAKKLLYNIGGYKGMSAPVDLAMVGLLKDGIVKGVTALPPIIVPFNIEGKSDINNGPVEKPIGPLHGVSKDLKNSARSALAALGEVPGSQPPEKVPKASPDTEP
jgi:hypothetical protein